MSAREIYRRYLLFGLAVVWVLTLIFGIQFHLSTKQYLPKQPLSPSFYCTDMSIHANCLFSRSLCYDVNSTQWKTSTLLPYNWTGVSLRSRGSLFRDSPGVSMCNGPFIPESSSVPSAETVFWINGTNVLSCIWVTVFGHIFLEIMLPAWLSMRSLADRSLFVDQNITYLLDNRCGSGLAAPSFSLLSHRPVLQLADIVTEARISNKSHICFERLVVGFRLQASLEYAHNVAHLKVGDLSRYRDSIKTLHNIPLEVNMTAGACVALLIQRTPQQINCT